MPHKLPLFAEESKDRKGEGGENKERRGKGRGWEGWVIF